MDGGKGTFNIMFLTLKEQGVLFMVSNFICSMKSLPSLRFGKYCPRLSSRSFVVVASM